MGTMSFKEELDVYRFIMDIETYAGKYSIPYQ